MCTSIGSVKVPNHKDSFRLRLLLTDGCNQNCSYCLNDFQEKPKGEPQYLKMGKILKAVREYLQYSRTLGYKPEIYLSGGEPTLHPRILDIIESIQDLYQAEMCNEDHKHLPWSKLRLVVCTNGNIKISLRNKLKKLQKKYKNIFFTVSLHLNHWPSKKWCHEVKANYSMVLTGKAFDYKKIMVDVFPKSLCDLMTIMVNAREKVKYLSIGIFYREYFNHKCHLKVLDNFHAPNPTNYEMKVKWVKQGVESTGKPCTVEMRPFKATNCLGCEDICCSHKSYWVRPDGTTSHCPKFKEVYHETIDTQLVPTIDVERAYGNHKSTYSTIKDILQSVRNMDLRHEGMTQMVDDNEKYIEALEDLKKEDHSLIERIHKIEEAFTNLMEIFPFEIYGNGPSATVKQNIITHSKEVSIYINNLFTHHPNDPFVMKFFKAANPNIVIILDVIEKEEYGNPVVGDYFKNINTALEKLKRDYLCTSCQLRKGA